MSSCRVIGCTYCIVGEVHYCRKCNVINVAHFTRNCTSSIVYPDGSKIMCRVRGCDACTVGHSHYCKTCNGIDVTHRSNKCPTPASATPLSSALPFAGAGARAPSHTSVHAPSHTSVHHASAHTSAHTSSHALIAKPLTYASMTVLVNHNGVSHMMLSLRSERLSAGGTIVSYGGSRDPTDANILACAIRECSEESGLHVDPKNIFYNFQHGGGMHFFAYYDKIPHIVGPSPAHDWEIASVRKIDSIFPKYQIVEIIRDRIWLIPTRTVMANHVEWKHSLIKPICYKISDLKKDIATAHYFT
jgi:8-oxo-dGTP pyrophosphatase MutT (NUDIX family)